MQKYSQESSAVTVIGAAFVAASIVVASFVVASPVAAQNNAANSGNSNYALLQEIRSLQQEVAELRDRVDRQEYAMQRLQSGATPSLGAAPAIPQHTPQQQAVPYPGQVQSQNNWPAAGATIPAQPTNPVSTSNNANNAQNGVRVESVAVGAATNAANNNRGARVEERDLSSALPINQNATVDQRTVGNQVPQTTAQQLPAGQATQPVQQSQQQPINNSGLRVEDRVSPAQVGNRQQGVPNQTAPVTRPTAAANPQAELLRSGDRSIKTDLQEEDLYARGLEQLKAQQYELAVSVFNSQLQSYPRGQRSADAYYWIGESLYILENLDSAKKSYNSILTLFPSSRRAPNALFKVAVIENDQGNESLAKATLQSLLARFPNSAAAAQAKARLSNLL